MEGFDRQQVRMLAVEDHDIIARSSQQQLHIFPLAQGALVQPNHTFAFKTRETDGPVGPQIISDACFSYTTTASAERGKEAQEFKNKTKARWLCLDELCGDVGLAFGLCLAAAAPAFVCLELGSDNLFII